MLRLFIVEGKAWYMSALYAFITLGCPWGATELGGSDIVGIAVMLAGRYGTPVYPLGQG